MKDYTTEALQKISDTLLAMPVVKKQQSFSKQDAIRVLSKDIATLQKRGYTFEQISEKLSEEGLSIKTQTLKSYLQRAKAKAIKKANVEQKIPLGKSNHGS